MNIKKTINSSIFNWKPYIKGHQGLGTAQLLYMSQILEQIVKDLSSACNCFWLLQDFEALKNIYLWKRSVFVDESTLTLRLNEYKQYLLRFLSKMIS